jgi:hypothetical protein
MRRALPVAGWSALGLVLLLSFGIDLENLTENGAIDLRNRVTGVRLLLAGIDPYHYKWNEAQPAIYADPYNNPHIPVSKTTATPALLLLQAPLAPLPYRAAQLLWCLAQWALLLGAGLVWWRRAPDGTLRRALFAVFLVGFTFTAAWRLHAERGQAYVLLLFLLALWLTGTRSARVGRSFFCGVLAGFLVALRPSFLFLLPFLALHRRAQLGGAALGLLLGVGLPMVWQPACWSDYFSAMEIHSQLYRTASEPRPGPQPFPATIEGVPTAIIANYAVIPYADASVHRLARALGLAPLPAWLVLLAPTLGFASWLAWTRRLSAAALLPGVAAWLFLADFFLPAYRNSYNDVLALNLVALALFQERINRPPLACCLAALPLGWAIDFWAPEIDWVINLPTLFYAIAAILLLIPPRELKDESPRPLPA